MNLDKIKHLIRNVPDFPKKGIQFKDITPVLLNYNAYSFIIDLFFERYRSMNIDVVLGIESRGFIFGGPLSLKLKCPFSLARKKGKLPSDVVSCEYELEYGIDSLELHIDSIKSNNKVLIIDDLLATGGTTKAVINLVEQLNGDIVEIAYLIELIELNGRDKFVKNEVFSLLKF